jgi:hypothetical protein
MATTSSTPSTAYITLSIALQAFYSTRGMWNNGRPCGALSSMLGQRVTWEASRRAMFFVSGAQIDALIADITLNGPRGLTAHQVAQTIRRFKEAAVRAGEPVHLPTQRTALPAASVPFQPLICPAGGRERLAFQHHVMSCLRDVVTFAQTSAY